MGSVQLLVAGLCKSMRSQIPVSCTYFPVSVPEIEESWLEAMLTGQLQLLW